MSTPTANDNTAASADDPLSRRSVARKLAYVVPAIVAIELARPAVALGRSGPVEAPGKGKGR